MNLKSLLPSIDSNIGRFLYDHYQVFLQTSSVICSLLVLFIIWLIKSKKVSLPLLTEVGLSFIAVALISVSDGLVSLYGGDKVAVAVRWLFACAGLICLFVSGANSYIQIKKRFAKARHKTDFMPLYNEATKPELLNPHGIHPKEDWHG